VPFGGYAPLPIRLGGTSEDGWTAEQHARLVSDVVALKRVAPLATWTFLQQTTGAFPASITYYNGQNGSGLAYAPTVTVVGGGIVEFAWASQYFEDEYGQQHPWKIRQCIASSATPLIGSNAVAHWYPITRGVRIRPVNMSGTGTLGTTTVTIW
jgi:hypothetical protein